MRTYSSSPSSSRLQLLLRSISGESTITLTMAGVLSFNSLAPKTKNFLVAGGLTSFVFGVYFYTMRAVGGTDELQVAIDKFEDHKKRETEAET